MEQHFSKTPKINGEFQFVKVNYSPKHNVEPLDGIISYDDKVFYFKYHDDFDEGNRYLVYKQNKSIFWFTLSYPYVNPDNGSPVHYPDDFFEDDRDFENGSFPKWHST